MCVPLSGCVAPLLWWRVFDGLAILLVLFLCGAQCALWCVLRAALRPRESHVSDRNNAKNLRWNNVTFTSIAAFTNMIFTVMEHGSSTDDNLYKVPAQCAAINQDLAP